ncbi:hypothetical protein PIB30_076176, partial [Stylosanthes scabra]|nr:hypothetical protein [Stylosanthes scabra]
MDDPDELLIGYEETMYKYDLVDARTIAEKVLRTRRHVVPAPSELARPLSRRTGFEYVAYMRLFDHDYALVSALLGLSIDGDPISRCMTGWELYYQGRSMEVICQELLRVVPGSNDKQGQKWTVNVSWFRDVCGVLEEHPTPQRLLAFA